jgi:preprotein translocase subunit SecG
LRRLLILILLLLLLLLLILILLATQRETVAAAALHLNNNQSHSGVQGPRPSRNGAKSRSRRAIDNLDRMASIHSQTRAIPSPGPVPLSPGYLRMDNPVPDDFI